MLNLWGIIIARRIVIGNPEEGKNFGELGVGQRIILKRTLEK
jgi:hypothetical protein